jgi:AcrR family transcriptional regulator
MTGTRSYRMVTRAAAAEVTRERIIEAACDAFGEHWYEDVTLRGVASDADVALQTVVNHFGSKDALFAAAAERMGARIHEVRWSVTPGDIDGAVTALVDDYERTGDGIVRMLAVEDRVPVVRPTLALGREGHQQWVEQVFAAALAGKRGQARTRRVAQLVAVTDVYTWKLLRRDKGFDRKQTVMAMRELVVALHDDTDRGTG